MEFIALNLNGSVKQFLKGKGQIWPLIRPGWSPEQMW